MEEKVLKKLKEKLEEEKKRLEEQLSSFARQDPEFKEDWETKYPDFGAEGKLEEESSEEEQYLSRLPVEHILELKLSDVNRALEKIKKGNYGICERCKKEIPLERLEVIPEARYCINCQKKK
jgi:DnaK suppressor protein